MVVMKGVCLWGFGILLMEAFSALALSVWIGFSTDISELSLK